MPSMPLVGSVASTPSRRTMAPLLAESLLACNGYHPKDAAERYTHWYRSGPPQDTATGRALEALSKGACWTRSGSPQAEDSESALRDGPLGLYYQEDLATVAAMAEMDSRITHAGPEALAGAIAMSVGVALLSRGESDLSLVLEYLASSEVRRTLAFVLQSSKEGVALPDILLKVGVGHRVSFTVPAAFAILLGTASFDLAVSHTWGQEAVTSMVGTLAGARYGVPEGWLRDLDDGPHLLRLDLKLASGPRSVSTMLWALDREPIRFGT